MFPEVLLEVDSVLAYQRFLGGGAEEQVTAVSVVEHDGIRLEFTAPAGTYRIGDRIKIGFERI